MTDGRVTEEQRIAELERVEEYAHMMTKALTALTPGGGSECFAGKIGKYFVADIRYCTDLIRKTREDAWEREKEQHRRAKAAEARATAAEGALAVARDKQRHYAELLDAQIGTPCEQIRHAEEVADLRAQAARDAETIGKWRNVMQDCLKALNDVVPIAERNERGIAIERANIMRVVLTAVLRPDAAKTEGA